MKPELITCIPNFSEARRPEVVSAIKEAISAVPDILVLDQHSDLDHNRTVITFVGPPETVADAAFAGIKEAAKHIDLNQHTGQHPRIGATDVVPFVPFSGISLEDCVSIAKELGQRVAKELLIPVYLYEEAATDPARVNLENIRRGEYEGLKTKIHQSERKPDYGPSELGPAGATVIGARKPLVAFNVYLTTGQVDIAKKISKTVRFSSGGLRYVKALGMLVDGLAQVSMNLTDTTKTPIPRVVELIRREAARYGVQIHHTELVGLISQDALIDAARWYLQLDQFEPDQLLESRIYDARQARDRDFLEEVASDSPAPGGGSAAAYTGALAAALTGMVSRLTIGRKKYADVEEEMQGVALKSDQLRAALKASVQKDTDAFLQVLQAYRLPKETGAEKKERSEQISRATIHAGEVPLETAGLAVETMELSVKTATLGNLNAISDSAAACALGRAALTAAALNVRINASNLPEKDVKEWFSRLEILQERAQKAEDQINDSLQERASLIYPG
ncbi:MAG: glutamate formimidoyltransferase [Anaerolineales bacterium]|nr:glutamate formimidoyltransferase [Anaerolineales bacterium]